MLNFKGITAIDSSGIGELVASYVTIKRRGAELKVRHLTPRVEEILVATRLAFLFEDFNDERAEIRSFG